MKGTWGGELGTTMNLSMRTTERTREDKQITEFRGLNPARKHVQDKLVIVLAFSQKYVNCIQSTG